MNCKKLLSVILFVIFFGNFAFSQISGISASKLGTYCSCPVPLHEIEFEPAFGTSFSKGVWDTDGKYFPYNSVNDSTSFSSEFAFRFTYGAFKNTEIGLYIPVSGEMLSSGVKYNFQAAGGRFAVTGGVNLPLQSQKMNDNASVDRDFGNFGAGLIYSELFGERSGLDVNLQAMKYFKNINNGHVSDVFASADFGYFIFDKFQAVLGVIYSTSVYDNNNSNMFALSINPGITIEKAENFILVLNYPIDILGKNVEKTQGFGLALTIMID